MIRSPIEIRSEFEKEKTDPSGKAGVGFFRMKSYFTDAVVAGKANAVAAATPVRSERATAAVAMNLVMMISRVLVRAGFD